MTRAGQFTGALDSGRGLDERPLSSISPDEILLRRGNNSVTLEYLMNRKGLFRRLLFMLHRKHIVCEFCFLPCLRIALVAEGRTQTVNLSPCRSALVVMQTAGGWSPVTVFSCIQTSPGTHHGTQVERSLRAFTPHTSSISSPSPLEARRSRSHAETEACV